MQQIIGRLIEILPVITGENERGVWKRGGFVIEYGNEYPKKVAFTTFGDDNIALVNPSMVGSTITVSFRPESREFNERWYTDLKATKVTVAGNATVAPAPVQAPVAALPNDNNALPF